MAKLYRYLPDAPECVTRNRLTVDESSRTHRSFSWPKSKFRILNELTMDESSRTRLATISRPPSYAKPELLATGIQQVWSWDVTRIAPFGKRMPPCWKLCCWTFSACQSFNKEGGPPWISVLFKKVVTNILTHSGIPQWPFRIGRIRGRNVLWRCDPYCTSPVPKALGESLFHSYFLCPFPIGFGLRRLP